MNASSSNLLASSSLLSDIEPLRVPRNIPRVHRLGEPCLTAAYLGFELICGMTDRSLCSGCADTIIEEALRPQGPMTLEPIRDCQGLFTIISPYCQNCHNRIECAVQSHSKMIVRVKERNHQAKKKELRMDLDDSPRVILRR